VKLSRRPLLLEFGPYGPSGQGGNRSTSGFSAPISSRRFNTWPFIPNAKLMMQKEKERQRRRDRLRELAMGWFTFGPKQDSGTVSSTSKTPPGSIS